MGIEIWVGKRLRDVERNWWGEEEGGRVVWKEEKKGW